MFLRTGQGNITEEFESGFVGSTRMECRLLIIPLLSFILPFFPATGRVWLLTLEREAGWQLVESNFLFSMKLSKNVINEGD